MFIYQSGEKGNQRLNKFQTENLSKDFENDDNIKYTDAGEIHRIFLDDTKFFQEWEGFGGSFTESAANVLYRMGEDNRKLMMEAYFHPERGLAYNLGRTHINSCDFSLGNWACCEKEDPELKDFSIERYKKQIIPMIKRAQELADDKILQLASPWSPPAWMKTNGEMNNGGKLKEEYRDAWALYYCKYINSMKKEGIEVEAITVQNEPAAVQTWDSCIYTPEDERDFVRDHLGPVLEREGLGHIKIICWDHNRAEAYERARVMFDDKLASKYVYGIGIHWYMGDNFGNLSLINQVYPGKKIWFTEGCQEDGPHIGDWEVGQRYAHSIIHDLNRNTSAWCDWNLFLDETGGPNHVDNLCSAPVIGDTKNDKVVINPSYYFMGHFSKFIKRGAKRVAIASSCDELITTAFRNPGGKLAVVVLNESNKDIRYSLNLRNRGKYIEIPGRAIQTLIL